MFINSNKLNFGKLKNIDKESSTLLIQKQLNKGIEVNDCLLPYFCNNNPYQFIICYRIILESKDINIEDWINLVFNILMEKSKR